MKLTVMTIQTKPGNLRLTAVSINLLVLTEDGVESGRGHWQRASATADHRSTSPSRRTRTFVVGRDVHIEVR